MYRHHSSNTMSAFRTDIQALRAIAVLLVLACHVWPSRLTGGYVGVDVFFVISGYLITGHLLREVASTGRVDLPAFYANNLPGDSCFFLTLTSHPYHCHLTFQHIPYPGLRFQLRRVQERLKLRCVPGWVCP